MKRNNSKARRLARMARSSFRQPWSNPYAALAAESFPSFAGACHHCGEDVNGEGFIMGTLAGGAPLRLCHPCGSSLKAGKIPPLPEA